jgi:hypothetical protein
MIEILGIQPSPAAPPSRLTLDPLLLARHCGVRASDAKTTIVHVRANMRREKEMRKVSPSFQLSLSSSGQPLSQPQVQAQAESQSGTGSGSVSGSGSGSGSGKAVRKPAFYITLPFSTPQDWSGYDKEGHRNRSAYSTGDGSGNNNGNGNGNITQLLPQCMRYDGERYVACRDCQLSSLTGDHVTYACYDITQLCPAVVTGSGGGSGSGTGYNSGYNTRSFQEETQEEGGEEEESQVESGVKEKEGAEPYLSSLTTSIDPRSRILAPKGGKKGGGGGKKGGAGRAANKHRSASKVSGRTDDAANSTNAVDDGK